MIWSVWRPYHNLTLPIAVVEMFAGAPGSRRAGGLSAYNP